MNKKRWREIEAAYHAALDAADTASYLAQLGARDEDLAAEVRQLLLADEDDENSGGEAIARYTQHVASSQVPSSLGDYRIVEEIGRGGMGTVYLAERDTGGFEQTAAIKIARHEFDSHTRERFLRERQFLARLNHPHIARLLDGGTTPAGAPYLVMEFVQGQPITDYCAENALALRARLELFMKVCDAVAYAHQHLIVHRDLKPSNILIDGQGQPKLLDFGIAKLIEGDGIAAETTRTELRVLTPNYAAPEQLIGGPISTATDCYALGVLLYELLCGERPYDVSGTSMRQVERQVLEASITRPSTKAARGKKPALVRSLKGDLDNIVLRCLAREPERRYGGIQALVEDISAYLKGRPVKAAADAWTYRTGKFIRRNRVGVAAATLVAAAVIAFIVVVVQFNRELVEQRNLALTARAAAEQAAATAEQKSRTAQAVSDYMVSVFLTAAPSFGGDQDISVVDALDASISRLDRLADEPALQAQVAFTVGEVNLSLGRLQQARALFQRGIDAIDIEPSPNRAFLGEILDRSGDVYRRLDQFGPAREHLTRAMHILETDPDANPAWLADTYNNLGLLNLQEMRNEEAQDLLRKALAINKAREGPEGLGLASPTQHLATLAYRRGDVEEALALVDRARAIRALHWGDTHPNVAAALSAKTGYLYGSGRLDEAHQTGTRALAILLETVDATHYLVADVNAWLGRIALAQGQFDTARGHFDDAAHTYEVAFGASSWQAQQVDLDRSCLHLAEGDLDAAESLSRHAYDQILASDHPQRAYRLNDAAGVLIQVLEARGEAQRALALRSQYDHARSVCATSSVGT